MDRPRLSCSGHFAARTAQWFSSRLGGALQGEDLFLHRTRKVDEDKMTLCDKGSPAPLSSTMRTKSSFCSIGIGKNPIDFASDEQTLR